MESSWRGRRLASSCRRQMPEEEAGDRGEAAACRETGGGEGRHRAGSPELRVPRVRSGHGARGWWLPREGDGRGCQFGAGDEGSETGVTTITFSFFLVVGFICHILITTFHLNELFIFMQ
jgi:hypothetical protein